MSELLDDLPTAHLEYALVAGVVAHWLVLGPLCAPLVDPSVTHSNSKLRQLLGAYLPESEEIAQTPAERAQANVTVINGVKANAFWRVVNCAEDGCVDLAQRLTTPQATCAWLYAQCVLQERMKVAIQLTTVSPTHLWINGELHFSHAELTPQPQHLSFPVTLDEGTNEILIRVACAGSGNLPMTVGLQIPGAQGVVTLPTVLEPVTRRQNLATVMSHAYLAQDLYSRNQRIVLRWPRDMQLVDALTVRLQTPSGRIYGEANPSIQRGVKVDFGEAAQLPDGEYELLLQPQFTEYYVQDMRVQRRIPFQVRNDLWSQTYYGDPSARRQEALGDAAGRSGLLIAEIAKSALGRWETLRHEVIEQALAQLSPRAHGFEYDLIALLGWVARMGDLPDFPQEVTWAMEESAPLLLPHFDEQPSILLLTAHLLAGQLYAQRTFADLNSGEWRRARAEASLLGWLQSVLQYGLPEGESQRTYADAIIALSYLVDLAQSDEIAQLAMVTLDKLAYQMALQSFLGAWGGSQQFANPEWMSSARLTPLSGVARLWWGEGVFNSECAATVALACCESYALPEIIAAVGLDRRNDAWIRRQDAAITPVMTSGMITPEASPDDQWQRIQRSAFRTGDYLLASMQGDWPVDQSLGASLWQVTLGPDALIFGNRPVCNSNHPAWQQSYWCGNGASVRVAQWYDTLLVGYDETQGKALEFSHAYFPMALFDEVEIENGWAFARKGNGYVALTATGGVHLVTHGRNAQREISAAPEATWLIQMGRASEGYAFRDFVEKMLALPLVLEKSTALYSSPHGTRIEFELKGPLSRALRIDGEQQPLTDFPHMESIYGGEKMLPAQKVDIKYGEHHLRLDLSMPEVKSAAIK